MGELFAPDVPSGGSGGGHLLSSYLWMFDSAETR